MKRVIVAIVSIVVVSVLFMANASADVSINIPTTTKQDVKLAKVLVKLNQERESRSMTTFATIEEALTDRLIRDVKEMIRVLDEREHRAIYDAWEAADEATKDQIRTLLGVQ